MINLKATVIAQMLGVEDVEAVELLSLFVLKLQEAPDKGRFLKTALRRALTESDKRLPR